MKEVERKKIKWYTNINEMKPVLNYTQLKIQTKKEKYFQIQPHNLRLKVCFLCPRN